MGCPLCAVPHIGKQSASASTASCASACLLRGNRRVQKGVGLGVHLYYIVITAVHGFTTRYGMSSTWRIKRCQNLFAHALKAVPLLGVTLSSHSFGTPATGRATQQAFWVFACIRYTSLFNLPIMVVNMTSRRKNSKAPLQNPSHGGKSYPQWPTGERPQTHRTVRMVAVPRLDSSTACDRTKQQNASEG